MVFWEATGENMWELWPSSFVFEFSTAANDKNHGWFRQGQQGLGAIQMVPVRAPWILGTGPLNMRPAEAGTLGAV